MRGQDPLLVTFVKLVDRLPMPVQPSKRKRGHPTVYSDRVFLKALVMMIVRHVHKVNERLRVLAQPTADMAMLRRRLREQDHLPSRRTWERQMSALPETRPSHIGCLCRYLLELIQPWATCGRAVTIDSTVLRAEARGLAVVPPRERRASPYLDRSEGPTSPHPGGMLSWMAGNCISSRSELLCGSPSLLC